MSDRDDLAAGLRDLRARRGVSTTRLAEMLGKSQSLVSKSERGATAPSPQVVEQWCQACGATVEETRELVVIAERIAGQTTEWRRETAPGRVRLQHDIQRLEAAATVNREFSHDVINGLAQTPAYAEAMFRLGMHIVRDDGADLADLVQARTSRAAVLDDPGKTFYLLTTETALRRRLVSPEQMTEQIHHLIDLAQRPNITMGVIPFAGPEAVHTQHAFAIIGDPQADAESLVLAQTVTRGLRLRDPEEVADYVTHFNELRQGAIEDEVLIPWLLEIVANTTS